jgi:hypothetical protein
MDATEAIGGPSPDQIRAGLASRHPDEVRAALEGMATRLEFGEEFPLPPFGAEVLEAFGDDAPESVQMLLLNLVEAWPFEPPAPDDHWTRVAIDLLLRFGTSRIALELELHVVGSDDPVSAARGVLDELARAPLAGRGIEGAKAFVSYLLDAGGQVRSITLEALAHWPRDAGHDEVVRRLAPELSDRERALLPQLNAAD